MSEEIEFVSKKPREYLWIYARGRGKNAELILRHFDPCRYSEKGAIYLEKEEVEEFFEIFKAAKDDFERRKLLPEDNEDE